MLKPTAGSRGRNGPREEKAPEGEITGIAEVISPLRDLLYVAISGLYVAISGPHGYRRGL